MRGFYLFLDETEEEAEAAIRYRIATIILCDGNVLNEDFGFYESFLTPLAKDDKLGSFADGKIRRRRIAIFPNPLSCDVFSNHATLIHRSAVLAASDSRLAKTHLLRRTRPDGTIAEFSCYQARADVPRVAKAGVLTDPFATVKKPGAGRRGMFRLPLEPISSAPPAPITEDIEVDVGDEVAPTSRARARPKIPKN